MLSVSARGRMYMATKATDLRKSYDGLCALVEGQFGHDVRSGDMYVFINHRATQMRVLYWELDGFCIWMKRLEAGTFRRVHAGDGRDHVEIDAGELAMLLAGLDAPVIKRRKRYRHHTTNTCF